MREHWLIRAKHAAKCNRWFSCNAVKWKKSSENLKKALLQISVYFFMEFVRSLRSVAYFFALEKVRRDGWNRNIACSKVQSVLFMQRKFSHLLSWYKRNKKSRNNKPFGKKALLLRCNDRRCKTSFVVLQTQAPIVQRNAIAFFLFLTSLLLRRIRVDS
jgi:hypothetical protein